MADYTPTERELYVLRRVALGHSRRAIGRDLSLTEQGASMIVVRLAHRIGANGIHNLIYLATRRGLLDPCVDPGREPEAFDAPDPELGFACGRGLGRCKEATP